MNVLLTNKWAIPIGILSNIFAKLAMTLVFELGLDVTCAQV